MEAEVTEYDFGEIAVAERKTFDLIIRNIGRESTPINMVPIPPYCGFSVINALRTIEPGQAMPVVLEFNPPSNQKFEERLVLKSEKSLISVKLTGRGVRPELRLQPQDNLIKWTEMKFGINFLSTLSGDIFERTITLKNTSSFPLQFDVLTKHHGRYNKSGIQVFSFIPESGYMLGGTEQQMKIRFQPDH